MNNPLTQCLKITEKVAFNIASEASYFYILSGQKFIKNAKNGQFWRFFEKMKLAIKGQFSLDKSGKCKHCVISFSLKSALIFLILKPFSALSQIENCNFYFLCRSRHVKIHKNAEL